MHIITGILLSLLVKGDKENNKSPLLRTNWPIKTVHLIPGRVRFRIPLMVGKESDLKQVCSDMKKITGVNAVEFNAVTGSILFHFEERNVRADLLFAALIRLLGLEEELTKVPTSKLNKEFQNIVEALNQAVYSKTNGIIDLYTALPIILAVLGVSKIVSERSLTLPTGLTLLWWAYNALTSKKNGKD